MLKCKKYETLGESYIPKLIPHLQIAHIELFFWLETRFWSVSSLYESASYLSAIYILINLRLKLLSTVCHICTAGSAVLLSSLRPWETWHSHLSGSPWRADDLCRHARLLPPTCPALWSHREVIAAAISATPPAGRDNVKCGESTATNSKWISSTAASLSASRKWCVWLTCRFMTASGMIFFCISIRMLDFWFCIMHPSTAVQKIKLNIWFKNLDYVLILALKPKRKYVISLMTDATNDFFFLSFFYRRSVYVREWLIFCCLINKISWAFKIPFRYQNAHREDYIFLSPVFGIRSFGISGWSEMKLKTESRLKEKNCNLVSKPSFK